MKKAGLSTLVVVMLFCGHAYGQADSGKSVMHTAGGIPDSSQSTASDTLHVSVPAPIVIATPDTQVEVSQPSTAVVQEGYSLYWLIGAALLGGIIGAAGHRLISGAAGKAQEKENADGFGHDPDPESKPLETPEHQYNTVLDLNKKLMDENDQLKRDKAELEQLQAAAQNESGMFGNELPGDIVFYMPQPNRNGRFQEASKRTEATDSLYAFHVQPDNPGIATFEFIAKDAYLNAAIGNEPSWISIACDRTNQPSGTTSRVKTEIPGQAHLKDGEWEITRKAKITYL